MLIQGGVFGLGPNSSLNQWTGRDDVSLQLVWQFDAFGIGNLARIKDQRGGAVGDLRRALQGPGQGRGGSDRGPRATSSQRRPGSARPIARCARPSPPSTATSRVLRHTTRFGDVLVLIYRPQEVVYALRLLKLAFDEYFTTVAEYNRAEFELFHALGYPAQEISYLRPPGRHRAGGHGAADLPAPGWQRTAPGDPLTHWTSLFAIGHAIR